MLALAALAVAAAALAVAWTRTGTADPAGCRTVAWDAVPSENRLPAGWSLTGLGLDPDGYSTALVGPAPSGASGAPESVFLKLTCYGGDAHQALVRSRSASVAGGAPAVSFAPLGDETVATRSGDGTMTIFVRRGGLVANLAASAGVDSAALGQLAGAVDEAMKAAESGASSSPSAAAIGSATPSGATAGSAEPSSSAEPTPQHDAPALEAVLPHTVNGTALASQSTTGAKGLGDDPSSKSLVESLTTLGKHAADLQIAQAYDPTGQLDLNLIAFRVPGVTGATLRQEVLKSFLAASPSGVKTSNVTVGGKRMILIDYGDGGTHDYLYAGPEIVVDLASSDEKIVAQVATTLP